MQVALLGVVALVVVFVALVAVLFMPHRNGTQRWFFIGPVNIQPSEFLKPAFAIGLAWILFLMASIVPANDISPFLDNGIGELQARVYFVLLRLLGEIVAGKGDFAKATRILEAAWKERLHTRRPFGLNEN